MSWLSWIVVGFIAGELAKGVTGVKGAGCIGTILIGIAGGILGGIIFSAAGGEGINEFSLYSLLVSFVGATLLLFIYGAITGGGRRRGRHQRLQPLLAARRVRRRHGAPLHLRRAQGRWPPGALTSPWRAR